MGRFTVISEDAFDTLQLDAGVILSKFNPANPVRPSSEDIIATTTGGINPTCVPDFSDLAEDVDNVPNNMLEYKKISNWTCSMAFTTIKFNAENIAWSLGASETTNGTNYQKVVPRRDLKQSDFKDVWWVGDKANGGAIAIKLKNALSTGGLSVQTTKNGKGTNAMTLTGHFSLDSQDEVPMEFYDIEIDEGEIFSVEQNLVNVTSNFDERYVEEGGSLEITLTPADEMTIQTVVVIMNGEDVTSTTYDAGTITIAEVTGNIVITAIASAV
jgi:hypothetical protein